MTLVNTLPDAVNVYVAPAANGTPEFAGTLAAGTSSSVPAKTGEQIILAAGREPFQTYVVTAAAGQSVQVVRPTAAPQPVAAQQQTFVQQPAPAQPPPDANAASGGDMMGPPNADGLRWYGVTSAEPGRPSSAQLVYGIPQSDAVQVSATCRPGAKDVVVDLGASVQGLTAGRSVEVVFSVPGYEDKASNTFVDGIQGSLTGSVLAPKQGESLSGFRVRVETDDGLWVALQRSGTMRYGRSASNALPLRGAKPIVAAFLEQCRAIGTRAAPPTTAAAGGRVAPTCLNAPRLRSVEGGGKQDVVFVNRSNEYRHLDWIDPTGAPVPVGQLQPGASLPVSAAIGQLFMVTDGPGNCIGIASPVAGQAQIVLTGRSRTLRRAE